MKKLLMPLLALAMSLGAVSCTNSDPNPDPDPNPGGGEAVYPAGDKDLNPDLNTWEATVKVTYAGNEVKIEGASEAGVTARTTGCNVDLDLGMAKLICVEVTGSTENGSLRISGERKHMVKLTDLTLKATDRPAINDQNGKRVFLVVEGENKLSDAAPYATTLEDRKGCLFAESHIVLCGTGTLEIKGNNRHGLATDGFLYVNPGVTLKVTDAVKNAIHVKGSGSVNNAYRGIEIAGGTVIAMTTAPSGKAMKCDGSVVISGGSVSLATMGDAALDPDDGTLSSAACIRANSFVTVKDKANLTLDASGKGAKGINADGNVNLAGGQLAITVSGDYMEDHGDKSTPKGIVAKQTLAVSGGTTTVSATGAGATAVESDVNAEFTGGSLTAFGTAYGFESPRAKATAGTLLIGGAANDLIDGATAKTYEGVVAGTETDLGSVKFRWPVSLGSATLLTFGF